MAGNGEQSKAKQEIYDTDGIHDCLESFAWGNNDFEDTLVLDWDKHSAIYSNISTEINETSEPEDVNDDLKREVFFYEQVESKASSSFRF